MKKIITAILLLVALFACKEADEPKLPYLKQLGVPEIAPDELEALKDLYMILGEDTTNLSQWNEYGWAPLKGVVAERDTVENLYHITRVEIKIDETSLPVVFPGDAFDFSRFPYVTRFCAEVSAPSAFGLSPSIFRLPVTDVVLIGSGIITDLPDELYSCESLEFFAIRFTDFSDEKILHNLCKLPQKCILNLYHNKFEGKAPLEMRKFGHVELSNNCLTSVDWRFFTEDEGIIPIMHFNNFSGSVPEDVRQTDRWIRYGNRVRYGNNLTYN